MADDWRNETLRNKIIEKFDEKIQQMINAPDKSPKELEAKVGC